jgi:hypothetical protein
MATKKPNAPLPPRATRRGVIGLRTFALSVWEFVVGDDWRIALGVAVAVAATDLISNAGVPSWWVLPAAVAAVLGYSLSRETRPRDPR